MKWLIIQEAGRHEENYLFRECLSIEKALTQLNQEVNVWGLGHKSFINKPDFDSYDVIFNLENYDENSWLPDLSLYNKPIKLFWAIDEHCKPQDYYSKYTNRDKYTRILHSTLDFVKSDKDIWFPNCFDESVIKPLPVQKRADVGFCGSLLNRQEKIELLKKNFKFISDIWVLGHAMVWCINSYKIAFNCNIANDINYRSFETVGCKIPLATNYNYQYLRLGFEDLDNCILYKNNSEMISKIRYVLDNDSLLNNIAKNGYELSKRHTYTYRFKWLIEEVINKL